MDDLTNRTGDYHAQLRAALPPGKIWAAAGSLLDGVLRIVADECARIDLRVQDMLREVDPRQAVETLGDWERELGLPDGCRPSIETIQGRRERVVQKLISRGGQSKSYFVEMAGALGYSDCRVEVPQFFTCTSACTAPLYTADWSHVWFLRVPTQTRIRSFTAGSACTEPLRSWGDDTLECVITRAAHAHTSVFFRYGAQ